MDGLGLASPKVGARFRICQSDPNLPKEGGVSGACASPQNRALKSPRVKTDGRFPLPSAVARASIGRPSSRPAHLSLCAQSHGLH